MATLSIGVTSTKGQISWSITGLGGAWNTSNYKKAGFATSQASSSGSSSLSGILTSISAPSSGSNTYTPTKYYSPSSNLSDDDAVTIYGYCQAANGKYYPAGSVTIVPVHLWMDSESMSYYYANVGGYSFKITATSISASAFWVPKNTSITLSSIQPSSGWSNLRWHYNNSEVYDYANTYTDSPDNNIGTSYGRFGYYEARTYTPPATQYTITLYRNSSSSDATSDTTQTEATTSSTKSAYLGTPSEYGWSKSGYTFLYWNTNRDGSGTTYYSGIRNFTYNATLYAIWQENPTSYTITLYRNRSSSDATTTTLTTASTTSSAKTAYLGTPSEYGWTNSGYSFTYWTTGRSGGGTAYLGGQNQSFTGNKILYAQWEKVSYTYYYRINLYIDGALYDYETDSTTSTVSTGVNISLSTAQSYFSIGSGYSFSYASAGANCTYSNGYFTITSTSSSSRSICNLYYVTNTYTVGATYGTGCSDMYSSITVNYAESATVEYGSTATWRCTPATGHTFIGWYSDAACTSLVSSRAEYSETIYSSKTLYAKLQANTYSAHAYSTGFESCFSSISVSNSSPTYGSSITFKAVLSNSSGYTFLGWYNGTGSGASRVSQSLSYTHTVTGSVTLYARARVKWTYSHAAGTKQISKEEWDRVQAFIHDRNGATFSYTATAGSALSKNLYNDTKDAIGTGTTVKKGQAITQALLDALVTNANNL